MKLPIDVLSRRPLQFRWHQAINTLEGRRLIENTGPLSPSAEEAVVELIDMARGLLRSDELIRTDLAAFTTDTSTPTFQLVRNALVEIQRLQKLNEGLTERIAAQSDLLSKKAEKADQDEGQPERAKRKR